MKSILNITLLTLLAALLLAACRDNAAPPLAAAGEPTLVFIYTEA